jgi:hypothetical protein
MPYAPEDYERWYKYEFFKMNIVGVVPDWITDKIRAAYDAAPRFLTDVTPKRPAIAVVNKFHKTRKLKKVYAVDPVNVICTTFIVHSSKLDISANFGFLYSSDRKSYNKLFMADLKESVILVDYCIAPSLLSQDGEYRGRIFKYEQFNIIAKKYDNIFIAIERFIIHKIEKYDLVLDHEHFFPLTEHERLADDLDNRIVNDESIMKFFIMFWLVEIYNISVNLQENHINPKFNRLFFPHVGDDIAEFKALSTKFGAERVHTMVMETSYPFTRMANDAITQCNEFLGQKLRPMNVGEVQNPFNINYDPWREMYLTARATDLVANFISPSFSIFIDWFYIKNSRRGIFDNEQQYKKLEFSDRALNITRKLREVQRITYTKNEKNAKKYIDNQFENIYDQIDIPIHFAKANIVMSNVTLGFIVENVGRTFYDLLSLDKSSLWQSQVGDVLHDFTVFKKYMWDICYALLCLNVKKGMTHSDLHLNNATINNLDSFPSKETQYELYNVMGYWFAMQSMHGVNAYIIDFSRATIKPEHIAKYPHFKDVEEYDEFVIAQNERMIAKLVHTIPSFMVLHREDVTRLIATHFDKFYMLYSAVDTFDIATKMTSYFAKSMPKTHMTLLKKIAKLSEHYLTIVMLKVIYNPSLAIEWPIFHVLRECFTDDIINPATPQPDLNIVNLWVLDKPAPYNFDSYKEFPPVYQQQYGMRKPYDPTDVYKIKEAAQQDEFRLNYEKYRKSQMPMVEYIAQRHLEKYL